MLVCACICAVPAIRVNVSVLGLDQTMHGSVESPCSIVGDDVADTSIGATTPSAAPMSLPSSRVRRSLSHRAELSPHARPSPLCDSSSCTTALEASLRHAIGRIEHVGTEETHSHLATGPEQRDTIPRAERKPISSGVGVSPGQALPRLGHPAFPRGSAAFPTVPQGESQAACRWPAVDAQSCSASTSMAGQRGGCPLHLSPVHMTDKISALRLSCRRDGRTWSRGKRLHKVTLQMGAQYRQGTATPSPLHRCSTDGTSAASLPNIPMQEQALADSPPSSSPSLD